MTTIENKEIQKIIRELSGVGIKFVTDPDGFDNICFEKDGQYWKFATNYFFRENGMCMTHEYVRKEKKSGSIVCKWAPITDEMFYQGFKLLIMKKLE